MARNKCPHCEADVSPFAVQCGVCNGAIPQRNRSKSGSGYFTSGWLSVLAGGVGIAYFTLFFSVSVPSASGLSERIVNLQRLSIQETWTSISCCLLLFGALMIVAGEIRER